MSVESNRSSSSVAPFAWHTSLWQQLHAQHQSAQLAHACLITGEQGIGKFALISAFANFLLCLEPTAQAPCGKCINCQLTMAGSHPDILVVQPEQGSKLIKVDQVRALSRFVARTSHAGLCKLVIINQAHNLNSSAANSLLKTLEEPANNTFLFLITERAGSLPATLRSRCQRLLLKTPNLAQACEWLQQHGIAPAQASTLAVAAGRRPLYALALAGEDALLDANQFLRCLIAVLQQRAPLQTAVAAALKLGEIAAVEYLLRTSSIVIKGLLAAEQEQDDLIAEMQQYFSTIPDTTALARRLLVFNASAEKAWRELQGVTNPNAQLLLESLLWQWSQLSLPQLYKAV